MTVWEGTRVWALVWNFSVDRDGEHSSQLKWTPAFANKGPPTRRSQRNSRCKCVCSLHYLKSPCWFNYKFYKTNTFFFSSDNRLIVCMQHNRDPVVPFQGQTHTLSCITIRNSMKSLKDHCFSICLRELPFLPIKQEIRGWIASHKLSAKKWRVCHAAGCIGCQHTSFFINYISWLY